MITDDDDDDGIIEIVEVQNTLNENPKIQNIDNLKSNKLPNVTTVLDTSSPSLKEKGKRVESGIEIEIDDKKEEGIIIDDDDDGIIEIVEVKNTLKENPKIQNIENLRDNKLVSVNIVQDVSLPSYKEKENQLESSINLIKNEILNDSKKIDDEKEEGMITDDDDDDDGIIEIVEVKNTLKENPKIQNIDSLKDNQLASVLKASSCIDPIRNKILNDSKEIDDEKEEGMITDDDDDDGVIEIIDVKNVKNLQDNKFLSSIRTSCDSSASTYKLKETQSQNTKSNRKLELSKDLSGLKSQFEIIKNRLLIDNKEVNDEKEEGMISDDDDMDVDMASIEKSNIDNINIPNISKADDKLQITTTKFKESPPKHGIKRKYSEGEKSDIGLKIKRTKNESFTDYKTAIGDNLSITFNSMKEARKINVSNSNKTSLKDKRKSPTTYVNDGEMPSTSKGTACSTSGFFNSSINDDDRPSTSRRSECSSPDYSGIDKLFFIDTTPGLDPNDCVPSFKAVSKNKKVEDKNNCPQSRNSLCFNCGSTEHPLSKCTEPKNKKNITRAKRQFKSNSERYHKKSCRYEHIKPGQMDDEVTKALGLRKGQMPSYRYEMRKHGYPPAWLKAAEVESSGLSIIIQSDDPKKAFDSRPKYRRSDIIDFPGFNSIPFKGFYDDYKFHNVPPLTPNLMKDAFLKTLEPYLVDDEFGLIDDFGNDSIESSKNLSTDSIDMELENDDEECNSIEFCGPLLPNKNKDNDVSSGTAENLDNEFDSSMEENVTQDENSLSTPKTNANISATLDSYVSTPLLNFSGYEKLPPISNFQKDVSCELLLFENLPGTTGSYTKIKNLLDKFKQN
ncbi:uncharacterized protein LOC119682693 [Teleopsis dalmanni]|uniref:uncharacterized protein LOC119682693 n=1 Tax=Teleopsis dalmanni TaxID=139649 RepID=UPI0018CE1336|nr:uncharacterized protein LOC119682693 [Teleopsis dalmanni]